MNSTETVVVTERPLRPEEMLDLSSAPDVGGQALFVGVVRDHHEGRAVTAVTYDCFVPLAERILADIAREASARWKARVACGHRTGRLEVGEASVIVAAGCAHRAEAFEACRYVIDEIKTRMPVWKKEHYPDAPDRWLDGCALHR
jgi:molybdopterin synthase catalytic subunit